MPRYYFDVHYGDEVDEDNDGLVFKDSDAAIADARIAIIEMAHEAARLNIALNVSAIAVADAGGDYVATVSIEDAMYGNPTKH
ncbi:MULTISPECIES: DUF6894 family protein [unclassified Rhizobium]|uniref:DUF6894 family protein n=1 Tax=unclassified Rhizobium TaxID=2613769 RepID=UPI000712E536|nr:MULTISPECIES: hypothetical protein [unclassified Rhizobium]KQT01804.1 hypothetical protein ASG50_19135 [Rhizobium sp. Leaf386]KQT03238.1 hypothetical protein ASG42_24845 [Rhizobium sp. Leaf391]KQU08353.1 hypothetical protein ASG68_22440 [Rhizobium sp. Leaf453]